MSGPVLSPTEITQLIKEKTRAESASATYAASVSALNARAAELAIVDGAFKKFFDYYNIDIIGKYDLELKAINGLTRTLPILEADIVACASLAGNRIQPALPATDVIRISNFDGNPTTTDSFNESQFITDQAPIETTLVSGYGGSAPSASILTNTSLTSSSTTLQLKNLSTTFSLSPGSTYVVTNGGNLCVFKILTFVMQVSPVPPPYIADLTIELIVPPAGTISTGQILQVFNGFSNGERTTKIASNPQYQPLMNYLVSALQLKINQRITALNSELSAISTNQDPDGTSELSAANTNVNSSKTFLTNYLITTDISNTGLAGTSAERSARSGQIVTRISQIVNSYTGRTKNYYNERYNFANSRANTSRGSLRIQKNAEQVSASSSGFAVTLASQAAAIGDLLP